MSPAEARNWTRTICDLQNPHHPGLKFKKLPPHEDLWSVRINNHYRAIGRIHGDVILWFFVGSHTDYDKLIARL
jgi:plasmid maintenance system killer protein